MRSDVVVEVSAAKRRRLAAPVADRKTPQKHVWRGRIILLTADGWGTMEIARRSGVSRPTVWHWQRRFMEAGVDGLLCDKTRPPGKRPLAPEVVGRLVAKTLEAPPGEATYWTGYALAKACGISLRSVLRLWAAHGLKSHKVKTFKRSNDADFAEKPYDMVGLYVDPPEHAIVLTVDEKSQIQALDRIQPGPPLKPGRLGAMNREHQRNCTATQFAALDVLEGKVIGQCMSRHRHQEFIRFLNTVNPATPKDRDVEVHNETSKSFVGTADPERIIEYPIGGIQALVSIH